MSLSEKSRAAMFDYFGKATPLGEEVTSEMIANINSPDLNDLVTKDHLDSRVMEVRLEIHTEVSGLRTEMHAEFATLRKEMTGHHDATNAEFATLRKEMTGHHDATNAEFAKVRNEVNGEFAKVRSEMHAQFVWLIGTMVTVSGALGGLIVALH
jgi:hypothetical protein